MPLLLYCKVCASTSFFFLNLLHAYIFSALNLSGNYVILLVYSLRLYTSTPLRLYASTPLRRYTSTPLRRYTSTPLRRYASTPLCLYTSTPLHLYTSTPVRLHLYYCTALPLFVCTPGGTSTALPLMLYQFPALLYNSFGILLK